MFAILIGILWLLAIALTIKNVFERNDIGVNTKLLWTILIVMAPVFGMCIYYFVGLERRPRERSRR